jgi:hypothetical protein
MMANLFEHLPDLSIAPFMQGHFQPRIFSFLDYAYLRWRGSHATVRIALFGNGDSGA